MSGAAVTAIRPASAATFAALAAGRVERVAPDFETPAVLAVLGDVAAELDRAGIVGSWLVEAAGEVVGLCGIKAVPAAGVVEIGYGIAPARRRRGHATRAVALLLAELGEGAAGPVRRVVAETVAGNVASARVLRRNGFAESGRAERGEPVTVWSLILGEAA